MLRLGSMFGSSVQSGMGQKMRQILFRKDRRRILQKRKLEGLCDHQGNLEWGINFPDLLTAQLFPTLESRWLIQQIHHQQFSVLAGIPTTPLSVKGCLTTTGENFVGMISSSRNTVGKMLQLVKIGFLWGVSKRRVKESQRVKRAQLPPDEGNGSALSALRNDYKPLQKCQGPPEDSPAFLENTCSAGPVLGYNGADPH